MANGVFTYAKGRFVKWCELDRTDDAIILVLLKSANLVADTTLQDYPTLGALLAGTSDEADFTNYARKEFTSPLTIPVNTTANTATVQLTTQTWLAAGGVVNNTLGKLVSAYRPATSAPDSQIIPMTYHDLSGTTTGSDLLIQIASNNLAIAS